MKCKKMVKEKKCHGNGRAKGHGCGNPVPVQRYNRPNRKFGLGISCGCYTKWIIGTDNGQEYFHQQMLKSKKSFEKKSRKQRKDEREKLIDYKSKLQDKINEIVRLIDIGLPCLAKGYHARQIHAGHIFSRGSSPEMRYNLHNIHRQSAQSNHYQNEDGLLREGLIKEYGQGYFDFISSLRGCKIIKYDNYAYKNFYKHACTLANELKRQGRLFPTIEERIAMRNETNNLLGIYDEKYCIYKIK